MITLRNVIDYPRIVSEQRAKMDPLDLKQAVIREINWQLNKLDTSDDERSVLKFVIEHRKLDAEE